MMQPLHLPVLVPRLIKQLKVGTQRLEEGWQPDMDTCPARPEGRVDHGDAEFELSHSVHVLLVFGGELEGGLHVVEHSGEVLGGVLADDWGEEGDEVAVFLGNTVFVQQPDG